MSADANARFTGSIPANYDRYLGPVLFEPYARDLARRLDVKDGERVLEIACGTGIVTKHLLESLPPQATLVATDLNEPMLEHARKKVPDAPRLTWKQADACALPFEDASFDAVVCQFGLMFVPDKTAAARETRRVLRPGGRFLFSVWDSLERNRFAHLAQETVLRFFPVDPPTFYDVPFSLHQREVLRALLTNNGFTEEHLEGLELVGMSPTAGELAIGLIEGNPLGAGIRERGGVTEATVINAVAKALADEFGDRPVRLPLRALIASARAGAPPLR